MPPLQRRGSMGDRSRRSAGGGGRGGRLDSPSPAILGPAPPAVDGASFGPTPSDSAPLSGGEFLLQLLRKPPQSSTAAPSPSSSTPPLPIDGRGGRQHLHHSQYEDPAVAAVGRSISLSPLDFSNVGSPQQQLPPWLIHPFHHQPTRPSPPMGFSPPGGFSVSPPAGFSVSPPGVNYHEPRSLIGGTRPPFFQGDAGQHPGFVQRELDTGDRHGNPRDTFSQQHQMQQSKSTYKQNHQRDGVVAGSTALGNSMSGSQPGNHQADRGRGLIAGYPPGFAGRSHFRGEQRSSKAPSVPGNQRRTGNGGILENKPSPNPRWASQQEAWSSQPGNQHPVCERSKGPRAPMSGQAPPGFQESSVKRHSGIESRKEASSSQQKPDGSGHRIRTNGGSDRDLGSKRPEYPQRKQNHEFAQRMGSQAAARQMQPVEEDEYPQRIQNHKSFAQRMGSQARGRQVQPDAEQFLSEPVRKLNAKDVLDMLSEDEDEVNSVEEQDNRTEQDSELKPIPDSIHYEEKGLVLHLQDSLVLTEEVVECEVKKSIGSRKKDSRTDFSRGHMVSTQRYRIRRGSVQCRHDIERLSPHFLSVYDLLVPTEEEKAKQKQLLVSLQKIVSKEWPSSQLHLYGSCANSFGVLKSDIDVCLEIDDSETNKPDLLLNLADILQSDNLQYVQALTHARVPIVKLMDPVTGLSCDICINNLLAVVNTKLLRDYGKIDKRLRQLAFIVKHWAKSRAVNETYRGTLSSYAYVIMCIHFLQMRRPPILPCLQTMEPTYTATVDGIECSFFDQVEKLQNFGLANQESIGELLWAFFNYWAYRHDYANDVISVRTGSILSKREKDWTRRIGNDRHLICIEDPFEVTHDLGRVVDKHTIKILREEFERAADILQFDSDPCAILFEPYVREPPPQSAETQL